MRDSAFPKAVVPLVPLILAVMHTTLPMAVGQTPAGPDPPPRPGTLDWALAFSQAQKEAQLAEGPAESAVLYRRMLGLYGDCRSCRIEVARFLERQLQQAPADEQDLEQLVVTALTNEPAKLGRFLINAGRPEEARQVVQDALEHSYAVERRLELLDLLARSEAMLGRAAPVRRLAKRLLRETPVSTDYCETALRWWVWTGVEPVPDLNYTIPMSFLDKFAQVRELERTRGNTAFVSCLHNQHLLELDRYLGIATHGGLEAPGEVRSLFPGGIEAAQLELARRTADPTVKAAILLDAARRMFPPTRPEALALVREALRDGPTTRTRVGALVRELHTLSVPERREEVERLALQIIDDYPAYDASCDGCVSYWYALTYPWPEFANRIPEWRRKCGKRMARCPVEAWQSISHAFPAAHERGREVYEGLLATNPPADLVPVILLQLRTAAAATDPERSWAFAREAIRHPEFPAVRGHVHPAVRPLDADRAGDFESALFLELLSCGTLIGGCSSFHPMLRTGQAAEIGHQFLRAYYELRLGIRARERWTELMGLLPTQPEDASMDGLDLPLYFERFVAAAQVMHEEGAVLDWFRTLQQQYRDVLGRFASGEELTRDHELLKAEESLIGQYIQRLEDLEGSSDRIHTEAPAFRPQ